MPLVRVRGQHLQGAGALRRGECPVTELTDTRQFYYPPAPIDDEEPLLDGPLGIKLLEGELLVFGWTPAMALVGGVGSFVLIYGALTFWGYLRGEDWISAWEGLGLLPLGALMFIWYPFFAPYRRFVVFDRRRGLVHLPGWFRGRRPDAVRWQDLGVLLAEVPGGYMGSTPLTQVYVVRPPSSLARREYPPWYRRIPFIDGEAAHHDAEQSWRRVATWMTEPLEASPWAVSLKELDQDVAEGDALEDSYRGDWAAFRKDIAGSLRPFYGTELLTEPNWVCDAEGCWQRRPDGPRERIELPDGPEEKRVPVDPNEPLWPRLRRRLLGHG